MRAIMSRKITTPQSTVVSVEVWLLSTFLVVFGLASQVGQLLEFGDTLELRLPVPAGATVLPGVLIAIAGVGTLLRHEWAFKLACILCSMHLTVSGIFLLTTASGFGAVVESIYAFFCVLGAFASWHGLTLSRARVSRRS